MSDVKQIIVGPKHKFLVEIELSEAQIKWLLEVYVGVKSEEDVAFYLGLTADKYPRITSHPSFDSGFGADINDVLAHGFAALQLMLEGIETKLEAGDLQYHPFTEDFFEMKRIEFDRRKVEMIYEEAEGGEK